VTGTDDAARRAASRGSARPTLAEVAALSGVSLKTASRALNGEPNVAEHTSRRVHEAADRLGFRLNGIARELRRGATSTLVGLITGDLANPFYSRLARGVEREIRPHGLQLVTASTDEDPARERQLVNELLQRRVRGLLVVSTAEDHTYLAAERGLGVPIVFLDRPPVGLLADAVLLDNRGGAGAAVRHLVAAGHRRIALVGDLSRLSTHRERVEGFRDAMLAAGIADWRLYVHEDAHDVDAAQRCVRDLLARTPPPTALFTTNNRITTGALRALRGAPRLPALVGFDDFDLGDVLAVTVVGHDVEEMGRLGARLVLDRLSDGTDAPRTLVVPTSLVPRGSGERPPTS
jgi:LacI family transcriptional regulator